MQLSIHDISCSVFPFLSNSSEIHICEHRKNRFRSRIPREIIFLIRDPPQPQSLRFPRALFDYPAIPPRRIWPSVEKKGSLHPSDRDRNVTTGVKVERNSCRAAVAALQPVCRSTPRILSCSRPRGNGTVVRMAERRARISGSY